MKARGLLAIGAVLLLAAVIALRLVEMTTATTTENAQTETVSIGGPAAGTTATASPTAVRTSTTKTTSSRSVASDVLLLGILSGAVVLGLAAALYDRLSELTAFGASVKLQVGQLLDKAVDQRTGLKGAQAGTPSRQITTIPVPASASDRSRLLRRADRIAEVLRGACVLWVDDFPENNTVERDILESLGMHVDFAESSEQARAMLRNRRYDMMISDIARGDVQDEGIRFLKAMNEEPAAFPGAPKWTILYTGDLDPSLGVPPYALGITDRPDHLLHHVMDALERERG